MSKDKHERKHGAEEHRNELVPEQETRCYFLGSPQRARVMLRVIYPTTPSESWQGVPGPWPGNDKIIREWRIAPQPLEYVFRPCNETEIRELEECIGELRCVEVMNHPTLGLVSYEADGAEKRGHQ